MNTQIIEKSGTEVLPYNEVAKLIDDEIHAHILNKINFLAREYEIRNPPEVARFLSENSFLLNLLQEIPPHIRRYFGAEQKLVLLFFFDPEDPSWNRLHIYIPTKVSVEDALSLFDNFKESWWFDNEMRSDSKIFINLRFSK